MARRVRWTDEALADVEQAAEYIEKYSRRYAIAVVRAAHEAAESLAEFGERGRIVPQFRSRNVRELLVRNHRLIYRVKETEIEITGFIHSARDLLALWRREGRPLSNGDNN